jgi:prophage antirepressor-like protein
MRRLDDDEKGVHSVHAPSGHQNASIINEASLYVLVLSSHKPEARAIAGPS